MSIGRGPAPLLLMLRKVKVNVGPSMIATGHPRIAFCARDCVLEPCTKPGAMQSGRSGAIFAFAAPVNGVNLWVGTDCVYMLRTFT